MALVECYECSKQMSDIASACPGCGALIHDHPGKLPRHKDHGKEICCLEALLLPLNVV